jgi:hypothetical protein
LKRAAAATTSFLQAHEDTRKQDGASIMLVGDQQWSSIMWAILSLIYRLSCQARLVEMRKRRLATAGW